MTGNDSAEKKKRRKTRQEHLECPFCHAVGTMRKRYSHAKAPFLRIDTMICIDCGLTSRWAFELIEEGGTKCASRKCCLDKPYLSNTLQKNLDMRATVSPEKITKGGLCMADELKSAVFEGVYEQITAKWEGGFDDDPDDSGGATNYGVSTVFLSDLYKSSAARDFLASIGICGSITRETIKNLTKAQAKAIFRYNFWEKQKSYMLPDPVAAVYFDTSVNCGTFQASKLLQKAVNATPDGVIGPKTMAAVESKGALAAAHAFLSIRRHFYSDLAARKPSQKKFLKGWHNRVDDLKKYITREYGEV